MNQHDAQHGHGQGDAPAAGPPERVSRDEQPDLAEHESSVPSSTTNHMHEAGPDLAEHESAVPSSGEDASPDDSLQPGSEQPGAAGGPGDTVEQSAAAIPPTGDDRVDEAVSRLAELDRLAVTEHAGVVEEIHRALQDTLAEEEE